MDQEPIKIEQKQIDTGSVPSVYITSAPLNIMELYFWLLLSLLAFLFVGVQYWDLDKTAFRFQWALFLRNHWSAILTGLLCALFPQLFRMVFGALPLRYYRLRRLGISPEWGPSPYETMRTSASVSLEPSRPDASATIEPSRPDTSISPEPSGFDTSASMEPRRPDTSGYLVTGRPPAEQYLRSLAAASDSLADKLFYRAGVYLIVGVTTAFSGLVFFYLQTPPTAGEIVNPARELLRISPRFGVLFFIEFIAFFFLRLYRAAMDEFRYYESIKRSREESLALYLLTIQHRSDTEIEKLLERYVQRLKPEKLAAGETTEILETRKLQKDELAVLEQMIEAVKASLVQK